jgi:murein DD-endopeptidase MepM/ murein hydrolase activator NlpD
MRTPIPVPIASLVSHITSPFANRRNPITGRLELHNGVDFGRLPRGTPIYAMLDGVVITSRRDPAAGEFIRLDHGRGINTRYLHLNQRMVNVGQRVKQGDQIGTLGSTGNSTGPHLHFEIRFNDIPTDPMPYLLGQRSLGPKLMVNNRSVDAPIKVEGGRTFVLLDAQVGQAWVQVRELANVLGAQLQWDQATETTRMIIGG